MRRVLVLALSGALALAGPAWAQLTLTGAGKGHPGGGGGGATVCTGVCELGTPVAVSIAGDSVFTSSVTCPAGSMIVGIRATTGEDATFTNSAGLTFTSGPFSNNQIGGYRARMVRVLLTADLPASSTFTMTTLSTNSPRSHRMAFACLNGSAFDLAIANASGTSTTPSITTGTLSSQPQYVVAGLLSDGGISVGSTAVPGYTQITATGATSGPILWYRRVTATTAETIAPAPHGNVGWLMTYTTMTAP